MSSDVESSRTLINYAHFFFINISIRIIFMCFLKVAEKVFNRILFSIQRYNNFEKKNVGVTCTCGWNKLLLVIQPIEFWIFIGIN